MVVLIYRFVNTANGKVYVGKTSYTLAHRKGQHISEARLGCRRPIHSALRKYSISGFRLEVIDKADTEELGNFKEKFHILLNGCKVPKGYNVTDGGEGAVGRVLSSEHRRKISEALKGKRMSPEACKHFSEIRRGKKHSPCPIATKEKISRALKGRPHSTKRIQNIRLGIRQKKATNDN
jgi:group I intron endonuclease